MPLFLLTMILISVLVVAGAILASGRLRLVGPVLPFELVRTARRSRYVLLRCAYAVLMLVILFLAHREWLGRYGILSEDGSGARIIPRQRMTDFAEHVFHTFMIVQFAAVFLLTPVYTAGAIAEEKDRRSLEFLFATDLLSREIVLGKLVSCLANLGLLILCGLPFLSMIQFLGGVDPNRVLASYAALLVTMVSLGSMSILVSVYARRPIDAIMGTYFYIVLFLLLSGCFPPAWIGNIIFLRAFLDSDPTLSYLGIQGLPELLLGYSLFHILAAAICLRVSITRLRAVALKTPTTPQPTKKKTEAAPRSRPAINDQPMLWKERYADPSSRIGSSRVVLACIAIFAMLVGILVLGSFLAVLGESNAYRRERDINFLVRLWATVLSCVALLLVALSAASRISREREQQTLDSLFTTCLEPRDVLWSKWLASVMIGRPFLAILIPIWFIGLVTGGLKILTLPAILILLGLLTAFATSLGLFFSSVCRSTVRATFATLLTLLGISILPLFSEPLSFFSPPVVISYSHIGYPEFGHHRLPSLEEPPIVWSLVTIVVAAILLGVPSMLMWTYSLHYLTRERTDAKQYLP